MTRTLLALLMVLALVLGACSDRFFGKSSPSSDRPAAASHDQGAPPVPAVLQAPPIARSALVEFGDRPLSFAPVVESADASVAVVKAVEKVSVQGRERTKSVGTGTAFVYDPAGYLLTNNHVISRATEIAVGFPDGREFPARVVGTDPKSDIAVLKVEASGLLALPLGDSGALRVGDWVVAIGNPFGLDHTASAGILSAKGRTSEDVPGLDETGYFDFLQIDAGINPGNSGGPLLNLKGEVVGINSAIKPGANSIAYAIPINMVKQLLPTLLRDGKVRRSAVGALVGELSLDQAKRLGLSDRNGAWVKGLQEAGPADRAGIKVDDVILKFDDKVIAGPNDLRWYASIFGVGRRAHIRVARDGKPFDVDVTLTELPD